MSTNRTQSTLRNYASAWKNERKHRDAAEFDAINAPERRVRLESKEMVKYYNDRMKNIAAGMTEIRNLKGFEGAGRAAERRVSGRKR